MAINMGIWFGNIPAATGGGGNGADVKDGHVFMCMKDGEWHRVPKEERTMDQTFDPNSNKKKNEYSLFYTTLTNRGQYGEKYNRSGGRWYHNIHSFEVIRRFEKALMDHDTRTKAVDYLAENDQIGYGHDIFEIEAIINAAYNARRKYGKLTYNDCEPKTSSLADLKEKADLHGGQKALLKEVIKMFTYGFSEETIKNTMGLTDIELTTLLRGEKKDKDDLKDKSDEVLGKLHKKNGGLVYLWENVKAFRENGCSDETIKKVLDLSTIDLRCLTLWGKRADKDEGFDNLNSYFVLPFYLRVHDYKKMLEDGIKNDKYDMYQAFKLFIDPKFYNYVDKEDDHEKESGQS